MRPPVISVAITRDDQDGCRTFRHRAGSLADAMYAALSDWHIEGSPNVLLATLVQQYADHYNCVWEYPPDGPGHEQRHKIAQDLSDMQAAAYSFLRGIAKYRGAKDGE